MVSMLFRDPQARSSALAALGTLQPRTFESLNRVETLDSVSNYYLYTLANTEDIEDYHSSNLVPFPFPPCLYGGSILYPCNICFCCYTVSSQTYLCKLLM